MAICCSYVVGCGDSAKNSQQTVLSYLQDNNLEGAYRILSSSCSIAADKIDHASVEKEVYRLSVENAGCFVFVKQAS